jgi:hypothetical protein
MKTPFSPSPTLAFALGLFIGAAATLWYKSNSEFFSDNSKQVNESSHLMAADKAPPCKPTQTSPKAPTMATQPIYQQDDVVFGTPADWQQAFRTLMLPQDQERFMINLVESNMRQSPAKVLDFLTALETNSLRNAAIGHALTIYAETSPINAIAQANQLLQGIEHNNTLIEIAHVWGGNNPSEALAWVGQQTDSKLGLTVLENVVSAAAQTDPNQMQVLLEKSLLNTQQSALAAKALAGVWAQTAPQDAIEWAKQYSAKSGDSNALSSAYLNWATTDPASAVAALTNENNNFSSKLTPEIANIWSHNNPKAAAEWAAQISAGDMRAQAIGNVAETWAISDPESALQWASSLTQDDKNNALRNVVLNWSLHDPQAFARKLNAMPGNLRQEISNILKTNQAQ